MFTRRKIIQVLGLILALFIVLDVLISTLVVEIAHAAGW